MILILWTTFVIGFLAVLILGGPTLERLVVQLRGTLTVIQPMVGALMIISVTAWLSGKEELDLKFTLYGFLLLLIALQSLHFYFSQFQAITVTLLQLAFLLILHAYRNTYLPDNDADTLLGTVE